jgi:hypothetical protein
MRRKVLRSATWQKDAPNSQACDYENSHRSTFWNDMIFVNKFFRGKLQLGAVEKGFMRLHAVCTSRRAGLNKNRGYSQTANGRYFGGEDEQENTEATEKDYKEGCRADSQLES